MLKRNDILSWSVTECLYILIFFCSFFFKIVNETSILTTICDYVMDLIEPICKDDSSLKKMIVLSEQVSAQNKL